MKKKGFTLIEILTVVLIIGILTSIGIPQYRKVIARSQVVEAESMLRSIYDSSERLAAEFGYRSYERLLAAKAPNEDQFSFGRMDMFGRDNMPKGCSLQNNTTEMVCQRFTYHASEDGYVTAQKLQNPFQGTTILLDRNTMQLFCEPNTSTDPDGEACDVFGLDMISSGGGSGTGTEPAVSERDPLGGDVQ